MKEISPLDYFAGLAMQAMLASPKPSGRAESDPTAIAKKAYEIAQAMNAERHRREQTTKPKGGKPFTGGVATQGLKNP